MSFKKFKVGDIVVRRDNKVGYISSVCHCNQCADRGFFEPTITYLDGEEDFIGRYDLENLKSQYKRIGNCELKAPKRKWPKWWVESEKIINLFTNKNIVMNISVRHNGKKFK